MLVYHIDTFFLKRPAKITSCTIANIFTLKPFYAEMVSYKIYAHSNAKIIHKYFFFSLLLMKLCDIIN